MSQTEPTAEAIVDLVPAKPKRTRRTQTKPHATSGSDASVEQADVPLTVAPKVRRTRRSNLAAASPSSPAAEAVEAGKTPAPCGSIAPQQQQAAIPIIGPAHSVTLPAASCLHPDRVTLARTVRGGRYALLPALGDDALLGLRLMPDTAMPADPYCALVLHSPAGLIELGDGVRLLAALTGIDLGPSAVELPNTQWLHSAVIGRLGQTPLRDVNAIARGCLPPDCSDTAENNSGHGAPTAMQSVRLTLSSRQHAVSIHARAAAATWLDLVTRTHWLREQLPVSTFDALPVLLPVLIATHALPLAMLVDIAVGDVVLPDTTAFDCTGNGRLHWRGTQLAVAFTAPPALTILSLESSMEPHDDAADDDLTVHAEPRFPSALADDALDGLPVQLRFEMGRCHTTLACLRTLAAGTVLPIDGGSPSSIAVVANGRQLGRGELVDVNGQLGIRIVHWAV